MKILKQIIEHYVILTKSHNEMMDVALDEIQSRINSLTFTGKEDVECLNS